MIAYENRPLGRHGLTVGPIAFGAASIGNLYTEVDDATAADAVDAAWESGVRYFDTAPHYGLGLSERRLGSALRVHPRDEYIVSTKVGRLLQPIELAPGDRDLDNGFDVPRDRVRVRDYSRDGVLRSIESSLERLGLDYIDIVLVHDPDDHYREAVDGAFPALEELRSQGVIRSYGAGMNQSAMLADFVRVTDLDVVMLAGRFTLLEQGALDDLLPVALERGVSVIAAGVFNSGILAKPTPSPDAHYDYAPASEALLARVSRIAAICTEHAVTLPQAAMHFPALHPATATICLGARLRAHIERNAQQFAAPIPASLWEALVDEGFIDERMLASGDVPAS
jgi:D-threo-aldose 1-dehydrogenase